MGPHPESSTSPADRLAAIAAACGGGARQTGDKTVCCCPVHDDNNPSLSIAVADDGKILVHCFAGCATEDVMAAIGLDMSFLTGTNGATPPPRPRRRRSARHWKTIEGAAASIATTLQATVEHTHSYENENGDIKFCVIRLRYSAGGKTFRPLHLRNGAWHQGDPSGLLPVYRLASITRAEEILIVEGEKCVDEAVKYGVVATTSAHGANSAAKTDWSPLLGKAVTIWPDNDGAGQRYAQDVAGLIRNAEPDAQLRVVMPDGLPEGSDLVDWIHARKAEGLDRTDIAERLAIMIEAAASWPDGSAANSGGSADSGKGFPQLQWPDPLPIVDHRPLPTFPVGDVFPAHLDWLKDYVVAVSNCYQVPVDAAALLILPIMALGLARRFEVEPQSGWHEPLSLYVVVLLPSGERKSAIVRDLLAPIYQWQKDKASGMADQLRRFQDEEQVAKNRLDRARRQAATSKSEELPDLDDLSQQLAAIEANKPRPPAMIVTEGTSEAISRTLAQNNERAILAAAEGDAIDIMLGRYSGSPNFGVWLAGHSGDAIDSVRRGREPDRLSRPALQIALCVQPDVLIDLLGSRAAHGRGVLARFLFSVPKSIVGFRELETDPVPPQLVDRFGTRLQQNLDDEVPADPTIIRFSPEARDLFMAYRRQNEIDLRPDGDLALIRSWGSKLPGALARIAGVLALFDSPTTREIGPESLRCALALSEYLTAQYLHVATLAGEDPAVDLAQRVDSWIRREGVSSFTRRDAFQQVKGKVRKVTEVDPALALLADRHRIRLVPAQPRSTPGRPPSPTYNVNPLVHETAPPHAQYPQNPQNSGEAGSDETGGEA